MSDTQNAPTTHREGRSAAIGPHGQAEPTVDAATVLRDHTHASNACGPDYCRACGQRWRGDPTTGGCTARLLAQRVIELEGALGEAEMRCAYAIAESRVFKAERDALRAPATGGGGAG